MFDNNDIIIIRRYIKSTTRRKPTPNNYLRLENMANHNILNETKIYE